MQTSELKQLNLKKTNIKRNQLNLIYQCELTHSHTTQHTQSRLEAHWMEKQERRGESRKLRDPFFYWFKTTSQLCGLSYLIRHYSIKVEIS